MIKFITVNHYLQKYIIDLLTYTKVARFSDLRPARTDTNVFSYHLKALIKDGLIEKVDDGYTLAVNGLSYVDRVGPESHLAYMKLKVISMLLIQNSHGDMLLQRRKKQPYIDTWTLPYGKMRVDDVSVEIAAQRTAKQKLGLINQPLRHIGICYVRVNRGNNILSTTMVHVFSFKSDAIATSEDIVWARPHKLQDYMLAPAVEEIVARGFFNDPFFFEEFDVEWTP
jgi:ADP-ribose pyrophosphatase YjhB (NUDIX family)